MAYLLQQIINGLQLGSVYALIALGYTLVYGIIRLINFAHGDVFMIGAYLGFYAILRFNLPFPVALIFAMLGCAVIGIVIEKLAYRPLRNAPRIACLITALGVSLFLENFTSLKFLFGPNYLAYPRPFAVVNYNIGSLTISNIQILVFVIAILLMILLQIFVTKTKTGMAMRAVAYDKSTAQLMGINIDYIITITFGVGSALAGAGGVLFGIAYPQIHPFMGIMPGLKAFVAAVLGGIGIIPGAMLGAGIMGMVEVLTSAYISSTMRDAIAFLVLLIVLLIKPAGLLGKSSIEKV
ncbi:MAG: branched-chain amino acid ABC transporter permease [Candidatus Latescibacteria bacterium]|nr:branched-chain amino acid ABC transporter permease [Candidatus Latescibacterota bacterium]